MRRLSVTTDSAIIRLWESVPEMVAEMRERIARDPDGWREIHHRYCLARKDGGWAMASEDVPFVGGPDPIDPFMALQRPYPPGLARIRRAIETLESGLTLAPPVSIRRRVRRSDDDGDGLDFDRMQDGESDFWLQSKRERAPGSPIVSIGIANSTSASYAQEQVVWRGVVGVALADILERAGYRVELTTYSLTDDTMCRPTAGGRLSSTGGTYIPGSHYLTGWTLKAPQDPMDVESLSASTSTWAYRVCQFMTHFGYAYGPGRYYMPTGSLGHPRNLHPGVEGFSEVEATYLIEGVYREEAAIARAREILANFT